MHLIRPSQAGQGSSCTAAWGEEGCFSSPPCLSLWQLFQPFLFSCICFCFILVPFLLCFLLIYHLYVSFASTDFCLLPLLAAAPPFLVLLPLPNSLCLSPPPCKLALRSGHKMVSVVCVSYRIAAFLFLWWPAGLDDEEEQRLRKKSVEIHFKKSYWTAKAPGWYVFL